MIGDGQAKPPPAFERVGSFRYLAAEDRWEWSDAVARMHGYEPGEVIPTTELVLSHKHPEDKPAVTEIIDRVLRHGAAFSSRHRIIDTFGQTHLVVVVGERLLSHDGHVLGTTGFYTDITEPFEVDVQRTVSSMVTTIEEKRAVINQAVGIVMWTYGLSAERAFDILVWRSQTTNTKLRSIAAQFLTDVTSAPPSQDCRAHVDHLLLTAHTRVDV